MGDHGRLSVVETSRRWFQRVVALGRILWQTENLIPTAVSRVGGRVFVSRRGARGVMVITQVEDWPVLGR